TLPWCDCGDERMVRLYSGEPLESPVATEDQYAHLESGDILFFPRTPFELSDEDRSFLLARKQLSASWCKNISYRPAQDRLRGVEEHDAGARQRMHQIMRAYSERALRFLRSYVPRYAPNWKVDFATFRPIEEEGRVISRRSRNDLIHIDAFPSRPSHG